MAKYPEDARAIKRSWQTDAETIRRQPVRGMIRRMKRNRLRLVETLPARTPFEVMAAWGAELTAKPTPAELANLAERRVIRWPSKRTGRLPGGGSWRLSTAKRIGFATGRSGTSSGSLGVMSKVRSARWGFFEGL